MAIDEFNHKIVSGQLDEQIYDNTMARNLEACFECGAINRDSQKNKTKVLASIFIFQMNISR